MRSRALPAGVITAVLVCSCSSTPTPTNRPTATPTAVTCLPSQPGEPGFVADPSQSLIVNGSFGDPSIRGRRTVTSLDGWTVNGKVDLVASLSCLPFAGNQYASLAFGASLAQTVPTVAGTSYELTTSDSREGVCTTAGSELDTYWDGGKISADVTFAQGTTPTGGPPPSPWGEVSSSGAEVVATSRASEVRIAVAEAAASCRFDVSGIYLVAKPKATTAP